MITLKRDKIVYWFATLLLSLAMGLSGLMQLFQVPDEVTFMANLGYPAYFLSIIGLWKLLGVVAILAPRYPLVKEWAYAGFFFTMTGAMWSHIATGDLVIATIPAALCVTLIVVSWKFRPADRKLLTVAIPMSSATSAPRA